MISRPTASPTFACSLRIFNRETSPERTWKIFTPFVGAFRKIAKSDYKLCHVRPSVRPLQKIGSHWTDFYGISFWRIFENMSKKYGFHPNQWIMSGTLHEEVHTLMIMFRSIFLERDTLQTKVIQKIKTHFVFNNFFSKILPFMR
jgi:hypothetical protein